MSEARTFTFEVAEGKTAGDVMAKSKSKARQVGIALVGDEAGGRFEGTAEGRYVVEGRTLKVEVVKKPAFVPWRVIESGLGKMFA